MSIRIEGVALAGLIAMTACTDRLPSINEPSPTPISRSTDLTPPPRTEAPKPEIKIDSPEVTAAKRVWQAITKGTVDDVYDAMGKPRATYQPFRDLIQQNINAYKDCRDVPFNDSKTTLTVTKNYVQDHKVVTLVFKNDPNKECLIPLSGTHMRVGRLAFLLEPRSIDGRYSPGVPTPLP